MTWKEGYEVWHLIVYDVYVCVYIYIYIYIQNLLDELPWISACDGGALPWG